jgi:predicted deacylase
VAKADNKQEPFQLADVTIDPGQIITVDLPVTRLYTHTPVALPVHVIHGKRPGPKLFISAAIHGDEINGVEIIHRVLEHRYIRNLRGTLVAIPIVNIHGFIHQSRYLPDRRDLNRSFPGSKKGSLAARLAHLFMQEIVLQCDYGIDLHTAANHRDNLPQIRANLDDEATQSLARAFDVPVLINSNLRDGSLREAATEAGVRMLLYEGGEALRFNEVAIRAGVRGIINVMRMLGMLPPSKRARKRSIEPIIARSTTWIRAPGSGILRDITQMGSRVDRGDQIALIVDPLGEEQVIVKAPFAGIVIGRINLPLANEGDALLHIARFGQIDTAEERVEEFHEAFQPEPPFT